MTHLIDGTEYLDDQERRIWNAVKRLNGRGRTTNSSQVSAETGISRTTVTSVCHHLKARGFLGDTGKGAAYHWRVTTKKVPPGIGP